MDLFERRWQTYRSVVTAACAEALRSWMTGHPGRTGTARLLDLGCGDLAQMGPAFRELPPGAYVGVDLTEQVLTMAREALGPASRPSCAAGSGRTDVSYGPTCSANRANPAGGMRSVTRCGSGRAGPASTRTPA